MFGRLIRHTSLVSVSAGRAMSLQAGLSVDPREGLIDEPVVISASGLPAHSPITIHARMEPHRMRFASWGHFTTAADGSLDLGRDPSISGTYTGVESMGLFWSMRDEPGQRKGLRLNKKDVTRPYDVTISVLNGHVDMASATSTPSDFLCQEHVFRWYKAKDVKRKEIRAGNIRGTLFVPPGTGPHPGVIDIFGTVGGVQEYKASLLASRGFATMALPWFGFDDLPKSFEDADFNYFLRAADWFMAQPEVSPSGIGVMGVSKGSDFALLLGMHCPAVKAVVSIGGTPFIMFCDLKFGEAFLPGVRVDMSGAIETEDGFRVPNACQPQEFQLFDYSKLSSHVLFLGGDDDGVLIPNIHEPAIRKLRPEQRTKFRSILYKKTGHVLEPPYAPICTKSYHKDFGILVNWGGKLPDHVRAQEHAWKTIQAFFREHLPPRGSNSRTLAKL